MVGTVEILIFPTFFLAYALSLILRRSRHAEFEELIRGLSMSFVELLSGSIERLLAICLVGLPVPAFFFIVGLTADDPPPAAILLLAPLAGLPASPWIYQLWCGFQAEMAERRSHYHPGRCIRVCEKLVSRVLRNGATVGRPIRTYLNKMNHRRLVRKKSDDQLRGLTVILKTMGATFALSYLVTVLLVFELLMPWLILFAYTVPVWFPLLFDENGLRDVDGSMFIGGMTFLLLAGADILASLRAQMRRSVHRIWVRWVAATIIIVDIAMIGLLSLADAATDRLTGELPLGRLSSALLGAGVGVLLLAFFDLGHVIAAALRTRRMRKQVVPEPLSRSFRLGIVLGSKPWQWLEYLRAWRGTAHRKDN
jgi:hypothetical protein